MNLSPDPQLATSTMDYDALLLKETKTNNDNIYLKSRFEELKETHKLLINQLVEHKIIKAEEWFETGDISSSLTMIAGVGLNKIEYLKEENATLKEVQKTNQKIREEYEKEIHSIKIAMGCDGPLSWDIKDILKWIEYHQDKVKRLEKDKQTFKDCVVEALGGPEFNGPYKDCIRLRDITEEIRGLKNQVEDPNCSYDPETGLKVEVVMNEDGVILYEETRKENEKLKEEVKRLEEEKQQSLTILQEANSDILGDIKQGLTKDKLKKENEKLKKENAHLRFLERHNITEEEFKKLVKESEDYDLPIDKEGKIEDAMNFQAGLHGKPQADWF